MNQSLASDLRNLKDDLARRAPAFLPINVFRLKVLSLVEAYTGELEVSCQQLRFRSMKSRWGSCSSKKVICINTKLKLLPTRLVELVVYHECLHLRYMHHGKEFKRAMRIKFPDYNEMEYQLKLYGLAKL